MHAHNAIRGELDMIEACFGAVQSRATDSPHLQEWQVNCTQKIVASHCVFVHEHHTNKDEYVAPALAKRFRYPEKLTDDHEGIQKHLETIQKLVLGLKPGHDTEKSTAELLKAWKEFRSEMQEHFQEEEDIGLPLMRAYFKPKEWLKICAPFITNAPKLDTGSFVHHMGQERFRSEFMKQQGIPFFVWYIVFGGALKAYQKDILASAEALREGVQPVPQPSGWLGCRG